jgi:hypothetical protein
MSSNNTETSVQLNDKKRKRQYNEEEEPQRKRLMNYSQRELDSRSGKRASERSILDRQKFEREFNPASIGMSVAETLIYEANPHIRQVFANERPFLRHKGKFTVQDRLLTEKSGRTPYTRRVGEAKTVDHWYA